MKEKFNPSDEEMKKGEDMMSPSQEEISALREESAKKLKDLGVDGFLECVEGMRINGKINGHEINIYYSMVGPNIAWGWVGEVDGELCMSARQVLQFDKKYRGAIALYDKKMLKNAQDISERPSTKKLLEDIGL